MHPQESSSPPLTEHKRKRPACIRWGCIACSIVLVIIIAGLAYVRFKIRSTYADKWDKIEAAQTEIVKLSEEWYQPAQLPSAEVVQFHHDLSTSQTRIMTDYSELLFGDYSNESQMLKRLRSGDVLSAEEQTSFTQLLAELQPLLDETSRMVSRADYTAELDLYRPSSEFLGAQLFAKLASIAALAEMRSGDPVVAMDIAALPLRLTTRPEQSYVITHTICTAVAAITAGTFHSLADQTSNTAALEHGLDLLTELRPVVFHDNMEAWYFADSLGALRFAAANGYPVDLEPQPLVNYLEQAMYKLGPPYYKWLVENLPPGDQRAINAQAHLDYLSNPPDNFDLFEIPPENEGENVAPQELADEKPAEQFEIPEPVDTNSLLYRAQVKAMTVALGIHPSAMIYEMTSSNIEEIISRAKTAKAWYDLTRLHFAHRLATLKPPVGGQVTPAVTTDVLNAFISPMPVDPFTSASFAVSPVTGRPYSVGPDRTDQSQSVIYDSTNGTISSGDIWME